MPRTIYVYTPKNNGQVGTLEERLAEFLPEGAFYLKNPEGTNAKSNQKMETFRRDWAKRLRKDPQEFVDQAGENKTVTIKNNVSLATLKRNLGAALGIPAAAIVLQKRDGTPAKDSVKLSTFRGYWSGYKKGKRQ